MKSFMSKINTLCNYSNFLKETKTVGGVCWIWFDYRIFELRKPFSQSLCFFLLPIPALKCLILMCNERLTKVTGTSWGALKLKLIKPPHRTLKLPRPLVPTILVGAPSTNAEPCINNMNPCWRKSQQFACSQQAGCCVHAISPGPIPTSLSTQQSCVLAWGNALAKQGQETLFSEEKK